MGVIDVSCGRTSIDLFDKVKGPGYLASSANWLKEYAAFYGNDPYGRIISMGKLAQKDGVIKGILVHQGENDSGQSDWPMRLKAVYEYILEFNLLEAEEETNISDIATNGTEIIKDGNYYAYDLQGKFPQQVKVEGAESEQLVSGYYILMDSVGNTFKFRNK